MTAGACMECLHVEEDMAGGHAGKSRRQQY